MRTVDFNEFSALVDMMRSGNRKDFCRIGNGSGVKNRRRILRVIPVIFRLIRSVGVHNEQTVQISGVPVGIFPPRINNAAVVGYVRKDCMTVIDAQTADKPAFRVARIEIADARPPARRGEVAPRRRKDQVPVREPIGIHIRDAQSKRNLRDFPRFQIHFIEMEIIVGVVAAHGKRERFAVPGDRRIANDSLGAVEQQFARRVAVRSDS